MTFVFSVPIGYAFTIFSPKIVICIQIYLCTNTLSWFIAGKEVKMLAPSKCSQYHNIFPCHPQFASKFLGVRFQRFSLLREAELFFTHHLFKLWKIILLTSNHIILLLLLYFVLFSFRHWSIFPSLFRLLCIPVINWWMLGAHHVFHIKLLASSGVIWRPSRKLKNKVLALCLKKKKT